MRHHSTSPPLFCIAFALWALLAGAPIEIAAQATFVFRNYSLGTNNGPDRRAIFLSDGVTRAQGSNVVVELWAMPLRTPSAAQLQFVHQTHLLEGTRAGLFDAGPLVSYAIGAGDDAIFEVRAWDRTTGTNYESASIKGATAFQNPTGGPGSPPDPPKPLVGFNSFCLGNPDCLPRPVAVNFRSDSYHIDGPAEPTLGSNDFMAASTAGSKAIWLYRSGELVFPTTVTYTMADETAANGTDYVQQTGTVTFAPLETGRSFEVPILNNPSPGRIASVRLQIQVEKAPGSTAAGRLWILGDKASLMTRRLFRYAWRQGVAYWVYCKTNCLVSVEFADDINQADWQTLQQRVFAPWPENVLTMPQNWFSEDPTGSPLPTPEQRFYRVRVE